MGAGPNSVPCPDDPLGLPSKAAESYRRALEILNQARIPHVVGGAYALAYYTGVTRHTKDFDLFIQPSDRDRALSVLQAAGYRTEVVFPFWLAKAFAGEYMIDLIYRPPNGVTEVNSRWFERAARCEVLGTSTRVCAPEEMLITKLFVLNNDRCDEADVMHLFQACIEKVDWEWLLELLGSYWRLLLGHLVFFSFVYPSERHRIPKEILQRLLDRFEKEQLQDAPSARVCNGTLLSHSQYSIDVENRGYHDGRLKPFGCMTPLDLVDSLISTDDPNRGKHLRAASAAQEQAQHDG